MSTNCRICRANWLIKSVKLFWRGKTPVYSILQLLPRVWNPIPFAKFSFAGVPSIFCWVSCPFATAHWIEYCFIHRHLAHVPRTFTSWDPVPFCFLASSTSLLSLELLISNAHRSPPTSASTLWTRLPGGFCPYKPYRCTNFSCCVGQSWINKWCIWTNLGLSWADFTHPKALLP